MSLTSDDEATAVRQVIDLAVASVPHKVETVNGRQYLVYNGEVKELAFTPQPHPLKLHTLGGLLDYLKHNRDGHDLNEVSVVVNGPCDVALLGCMDEQCRRAHLAQVAPHVTFPNDLLNRAQSQEVLVTRLQQWFRPTKERDDLLQTIGTLVGEAATTMVDDGVTQNVVAKARNGVGNVPLKNPVMLNPLRSFPEIDIGPVPFIVRASGGGGGVAPQIALHEADGGLWIATAAAAIQRYLISQQTREHKDGKWVVLA